MLIDPHVNPRGMTPEELIDRMIESSIDGAVITCTHDTQEAIPYMTALIDDEFICFVGVELRTVHGDLVFIPREADDHFFAADWEPNADQRAEFSQDGVALWSEQALLAKLDSYDGVILVSHPYSRLSERAWGDRAFTLSVVNAVETRIGRGLPHRDYLSDQIADFKGWSRLGSSGGDCHFLGNAATVIGEDVETQGQLCDALESALCWPIEFEDPMFPRARYQGVISDEGPRRISLEEKERKEALNELDRRRGYDVDEPVQTYKAGGRWGQGQGPARVGEKNQSPHQRGRVSSSAQARGRK